MPSPPAKKAPAAEVTKKAIAKTSLVSDSVFMSHQFLMTLFALCMVGVAFLDNPLLIQLMMVFVLAAWVGYMLVEGVAPALHTPLKEYLYLHHYIKLICTYNIDGVAPVS